MFTTRWRLFRLLGIPIAVDASWLIILVLMTLSYDRFFPRLLEQVYPGLRETLPSYDYWIMGLVTTLTFFGCIVLHELGHAMVARARGMRIRGITLFLFGGVAEIADEPPSALTEFLMAIGGPIVSLLLAGLFYFLAAAGFNHEWPPAIVLVLNTLFMVNAMVLIFNLIPAFPLDGGRVFRSILWALSGNLRRATRWATLIGQAFAWLLIVQALLLIFGGRWGEGIWIGVMGLFLNNAARSSYQQVLIRQALQGEPVRRFMTSEPITVAPTLDLQTWVDDYVYRHHRKFFPVVEAGRLLGYISTRALEGLPRAEWARHTIAERMQHHVRALTISPSADALTALSKMQRTGLSRLLVTEGDRLVGIVSLKDLLLFLNLKLQLEAEEHDDHPRKDSDHGAPGTDQAPAAKSSLNPP